MSVKVTANAGLRDRAEAAAKKAAEATFRELFAAMQQAVAAKAWNWPRDLPTRGLSGASLSEKLRNYNAGKGKRAGNPRNIVDTGNLRQTGSWSMEGSYRATFRWSASYATAVHEGARIRPWGNKRAALVTLPARPWTSAVMGKVRVPGIEPFPTQRRLKDVWLAYFKASRR